MNRAKKPRLRFVVVENRICTAVINEASRRKRLVVQISIVPNPRAPIAFNTHKITNGNVISAHWRLYRYPAPSISLRKLQVHLTREFRDKTYLSFVSDEKSVIRRRGDLKKLVYNRLYWTSFRCLRQKQYLVASLGMRRHGLPLDLHRHVLSFVFPSRDFLLLIDPPWPLKRQFFEFPMNPTKKRQEPECDCGFEESIDWKDDDSDKHVTKRIKLWVNARRAMEIDSLSEVMMYDDVDRSRELIKITQEEVIEKASAMITELQTIVEEAQDKIGEARHRFGEQLDEEDE